MKIPGMLEMVASWQLLNNLRLLQRRRSCKIILGKHSLKDQTFGIAVIYLDSTVTTEGNTTFSKVVVTKFSLECQL